MGFPLHFNVYIGLQVDADAFMNKYLQNFQSQAPVKSMAT
jgi:hypothetical protein